jgi:5'-nucleotidase
MVEDRRPADTTEGKQPATPSKQRGTFLPSGKRAAALWKGGVAVIGVVSTIITTLFVLVDHGIVGGDSTDSEHEVLNVAARDLAGELQDEAYLAGESPLGNLVADAQRKAMKTQLAFTNPWGLRAKIQSGEVTRADLAAVQPFDNKLIKMNLTGAQIWTLLREQFKSSRIEILQVSGLRFAYHLTSATTGVIEAVDELPDGGGPRPIPNDNGRSYTVTVNSYLAGGGDGFTVLTKGTNRTTSETSDLQALIDYVTSLPHPFESARQGRIIRSG